MQTTYTQIRMTDSEALPISPEVRLLLTCCNSQRDANDICKAAEEVRNWPAVLEMAQHHLIVPLLHHRLSKSASAVPPDILHELAKQNRLAAVKSLLLQAELRYLVSQHIKPEKIRYVALKGLSLSQRYYGDASRRQARDIDILIDPARVHALTEDLLDVGYRLIDDALIRSKKDLSAYCAMHAEVNMTSPRGVIVQLHKVVDFTGCQYPITPSTLFENAESVIIQGDRYSAMPTTELFLYICYHHGRHQWSRMHWIADLDAVISDSAFNRDTVLTRARALGMEPVVRAALQLHWALILNQRMPSAVDPFSRQVIVDCLSYLREGSKPPEQMRVLQRRTGLGIWANRIKEFRYNWIANSHFGNRIRYIFSLSRATYADYLFLPLPPALFSLYFLLRPLRWLVETLRGRQTHAAKLPPRAS